MPRKLWKSVLVCCILAGLVSGCGYRLGALQPSEADKKLAVPTFINRTQKPGLETNATNAVIERLQIDGTYKLVADPDQADYVLLGELESYSRDALTFDNSDVTKEFRLTIGVNLIFKDAKTGDILWKETHVTGEDVYPRGSDQSDEERRFLPRVMLDLARNISEKVTDGGW